MKDTLSFGKANTLCLFLLMILLSVISKAQSIRGIVKDSKTNEPIPGVSVYIEDMNEGTVTDENGEFFLNDLRKINENDTICFSHIRYFTKKTALSELKECEYVTALIEDPQAIKEVIVKRNRDLQPYIRFKKLSSCPEALFAFGSVLVENKIYVIGGDMSYYSDEARKAFDLYGIGFLDHSFSNRDFREFSGNLYTYKIEADEWLTSDLKFRERAYHSVHYYKDRIYVIGGKRLSDNRRLEYLDDFIEVYDMKKDTILLDHVNPHQAVNFASAVYGDILIVLGGSVKLDIVKQKIFTEKIHTFHFKTGYWYELKNMPDPKEAKCLLVNDKMYLTGGYHNTPLNTFETLDLVSGDYDVEAHLFYEAERPGAVYYDDVIYVFNDGFIQTYNTLTKEMNAYRINLPLKFSELYYYDGKLYIIGGYTDDEYSISPSADVYSIDMNEFNKTKAFQRNKE